MEEMKTRHRRVQNWPKVTPAVSPIFFLQSGSGERLERVQAADRESKQAGQEQEVLTAGRENPISFTHSRSRMKQASRALQQQLTQSD